MVDAGALGELEALRAKNLDPDLPLMKAVSVPEFMAHLAGKIASATTLPVIGLPLDGGMSGPTMELATVTAVAKSRR